jgi:hypothetical protein
MKLFYAIKAWAMGRLAGPDAARVKALKVRPCDLVVKNHETGADKGRAWAHCGHVADTVCIHPGFTTGLIEECQAGVLLHEIGHVLAAPAPDEKDADVAVLKQLGVLIEYSGKEGIQFIGAGALKTILKAQKKETKA